MLLDGVGIWRVGFWDGWDKVDAFVETGTFYFYRAAFVAAVVIIVWIIISLFNKHDNTPGMGSAA